MHRLADWETRLGGVLEAARDRPFELGSWDCALFGAAVIEALTGEDHGAPYRGRYTTARGYLKALKSEGHADIYGPFDALAARAAPLLCRRGDIVTEGSAVGVMWHGCALFLGPVAGFERVPLRRLQFGWNI